MNNKLTVFLFFSILLISCDKKQNYQNAEYFTLNDFQENREIKSTLVELDSIYRPLNICCYDSLLIISDEGSDCLLHIYNRSTGHKLKEFLEWGNGPDEMQHISGLQIIGDSLFVYDQNQTKYMLFSLQTIMMQEKVQPDRNKIIKGSSCTKLLSLPDGIIVANNLDPKAKAFSVYNSNSEFLYTKGEFPENSHEYHSDFAAKLAFEYEINSHPSAQKVAVCYKLTDLIEIYDFSLNLLKRIQGPDYFFPIIKEEEKGNFISAGGTIGISIEAYGTPIVTEKEIWALYSGKIMGSKEHGYLKDKLFVFDWNGNPLRTYQLDVPIFRFDIDPVENKIYAITDIPEFHIVKFDIQ
jgi:hypothetical protein